MVVINQPVWSSGWEGDPDTGELLSLCPPPSEEMLYAVETMLMEIDRQHGTDWRVISPLNMEAFQYMCFNEKDGGPEKRKSCT